MADAMELLGAAIGKVCYQLKELTDRVGEIGEALEDHVAVEQNDDPPVFTVETTDPQEMQRYLKATDALMVLYEVLNGSWQLEMIEQRKADETVPQFDGYDRRLTPSEAMQLYKDRVVGIMKTRGINLDELL